jgi:copper chaperone
MKKLIFQTDLQCGGCVRKIETGLNELPCIDHWEVDLQHDQRPLSVWGQEIDPKNIEAVFESCGFEAKLSEPTE